LLPEGFPERFSTEELRCIFMHELAHIKRGDLGVNWLVSVLRVVHWFNPILWLAWARMRADREMATDALVLSHGAEIERIAYGETILKIVENFAQRTAQPGLVGVAEGKAGLRERLLAISTFGRVRVWRWAAVVVAIIVAWVGMTSAEQTDPPQVAAKAQLTEISGRVLDSSGRPVGGVQLGIVRPLVGHQSGIADPGIGKARLFDPKIPHLVGEPRLENEPWSFCTTDTQGRFYLNDFAGSGRLLAAHETGYADVPTNSFSTNMTITLEPWGKIEGTLWRNDRRISDGSVSIGYTFSTFDNMVRKFNPIPSSMESVWYPDTANSTSGTSFGAITDDSGHYAFDFVRPGQYEIFATGVRERVTVNANETTVADIGGKGRPVIGQFRIRNPYVKINWEDSWDSAFGFCYFATEPAKPAEPFKSREQHMAWRRALEADRGLDNSERGYHVMIAKDGSFSIERVEPGTYALELYLFDPRHRLSNSRDFPAYLGTNVFGQYDGYDRTFEVPANKTNPSEPLDLGVIEISLKE
jgi:hypothetical protein